MNSSNKIIAWKSLENELWGLSVRWEWLEEKAENCETTALKSHAEGTRPENEGGVSSKRKLLEDDPRRKSASRNPCAFVYFCSCMRDALNQIVEVLANAREELNGDLGETDESSCGALYDAAHCVRKLSGFVRDCWNLSYKLLRAKEIEMATMTEKLVSRLTAANEMALKFSTSCWQMLLEEENESQSDLAVVNCRRAKVKESCLEVGHAISTALVSSYALALDSVKKFRLSSESKVGQLPVSCPESERGDIDQEEPLPEENQSKTDIQVKSMTEKLGKINFVKEPIECCHLKKATTSKVSEGESDDEIDASTILEENQSKTDIQVKSRAEKRGESSSGRKPNECYHLKQATLFSVIESESDNESDASTIENLSEREFKIDEWQILIKEVEDLKEEWKNLKFSFKKPEDLGGFRTIQNAIVFPSTEGNVNETMTMLTVDMKTAFFYSLAELNHQIETWSTRAEQEAQGQINSVFNDREDALLKANAYAEQLKDAFFMTLLLSKGNNRERLLFVAGLLPEHFAKCRKLAMSLILCRAVPVPTTNQLFSDVEERVKDSLERVVNPHALCRYLAQAIVYAHSLSHEYVRLLHTQ